MNYHLALWLARWVGNVALVCGIIGGVLFGGSSLFILGQADVVGTGAVLVTALMGIVVAVVYVLIGGIGFAMCAALHYYLSLAVAAEDMKLPRILPPSARPRQPEQKPVTWN